MLCFQSALDLGISGICIQQYIVGNIFYSTFMFILHNELKCFFRWKCFTELRARPPHPSYRQWAHKWVLSNYITY